MAALFAATLLVACGGDSTTEKIVEVAAEHTSVVASVADLPMCTDENEGEQAFVKGETSARICVDGKWFALKESDGSADVDFACSTKELKDRSGIKIICNGDSIGVVQNGEQGETGADGKDGAGCTIADQTDTTVTITCGDKSMVMNLGAGGLSIDTTMLDSEKVAVSLDSLAGYSQKGPFLKGSSVYLYELQDGRTLKQTNGNFTSNIMSDNGRYKFNARNLVSQYAMVVVDGHYRNEVTGENSKTAIKLKALTDMIARKSANVNLLTHLEFERVYYLVTKQKKRVKAAKREAQAEILREFHIDTTGLNGFSSAEDLDVFGSSDADAALLAISILLQGNRTEAELMALLSEISNDMAESGAWAGARADSIKAAMAIWGLNNHGRMKDYRNNVKGWGLGDVPEFEKYLEHFVDESLGLSGCDNTHEGEKLTVNNRFSPFNGKTYVCKNGDYVEVHAEKTHFNPAIQYGEMIDLRDHKVYKTVDIGTQTWMAENLNFADTVAYPALLDNMACLNNKPENCDSLGRLYSFGVATDSAEIYAELGKNCWQDINNYEYCAYKYPVRGLCPEGWHVPNVDEWRLLWVYVGSGESMLSKVEGGTDDFGFSVLNAGYVSGQHFSTAGAPIQFIEIPYYVKKEISTFYSSAAAKLDFDSYYSGSGVSFANVWPGGYLYPVRCVKDKDIEYGSFEDPRDHQIYKTVNIGTKTWLAENMNYRTPSDTSTDSSSYCLYGKIENCDKLGRYYNQEGALLACPSGWHLPDSAEWFDAFKLHGRSQVAMLGKGHYATNSLGLGLLPLQASDMKLNQYVDFDDYMEKTSSIGYVLGDGICASFSTTSDLNYGNIGIGGVGQYCTPAPVRCVKD